MYTLYENWINYVVKKLIFMYLGDEYEGQFSRYGLDDVNRKWDIVENDDV